MGPVCSWQLEGKPVTCGFKIETGSHPWHCIGNALSRVVFFISGRCWVSFQALGSSKFGMWKLLMLQDSHLLQRGWSVPPHGVVRIGHMQSASAVPGTQPQEGKATTSTDTWPYFFKLLTQFAVSQPVQYEGQEVEFQVSKVQCSNRISAGVRIPPLSSDLCWLAHT